MNPNQQTLPTESYTHSPAIPFQGSDTVFHFNQLTTYYDAPGNFAHILEGQHYGFAGLSLNIAETHPGGGPPLHKHECEEAHVLLVGKTSYIIGDQRFTVEAPYVVKIPAGTPHTFINAGSQPIHLVSVFSDSHFTFAEVGPNPLLTK